MTTEIIAWCGSLGTILAGTLAFIERYKNRRSEDGKKAAEAKDELIKSLKEDRDSWKSIGEATQRELAAYRDHMHKVVDDANTKMLALTDDNAKLKHSTDITPLLAHTAEQSQINIKILSGLDMILSHLKRLRAATKKKPPIKK